MLSHQSTHVTNQTHFAVLTDVLTRTHHGSRGSAEGRRAHPASAASIALPCGDGSPLIPPTITADAAVAFLNGSSCSALLLAAFCLRRRRIACKAAPSFFHASFAALNRPSVRVRPPVRIKKSSASVGGEGGGNSQLREGGREGGEREEDQEEDEETSCETIASDFGRSATDAESLSSDVSKATPPRPSVRAAHTEEEREGDREYDAVDACIFMPPSI